MLENNEEETVRAEDEKLAGRVSADATPDGSATGSSQSRFGVRKRSRRNQLRWDRDLAPRAAIANAFQQVVHYARDESRTPGDPERSVHEGRKSIRRLRALLKLVRETLAKDTVRELDIRLRDAARQTSSLRDARILCQTLDGLPDRARSLDAHRSARALLVREISALESQQREVEALDALNEALAPLPRAFASALPESVRPEDVQGGLLRSFDRAGKRRRRAKQSGKDQAIHDWRKRVKEMRYQLELLTTFEDPTVRRFQKKLAGLAESLGAVTDLIVLESYLAKHRADLEKSSPRKLERRVRKEISRRAGRVVEQSARLFGPQARETFRAAVSRVLDGT